jgi:transcriptional regulator with XRE-family HTH domain
MEAGPQSLEGDKEGSALDQHVGQRLRAQRVANGLQVITISSALGVTEQRVADWETGLYRIPARYLLSISRLLSCPLTVFFEDYLDEVTSQEEIDPSENRVNWLFNRLSEKH